MQKKIIQNSKKSITKNKSKFEIETITQLELKKNAFFVKH